MASAANSEANRRVARHKRIMVWSFLIILAGALILPLAGYLSTGVVSVHAATEEATNPRANYWRAVREGNTGYTAVKGQETNVLIQNGGQNWRQLRNGPVASIAPWWLALILLLIGMFHVLRGPVKLDQAQSGQTVERWSLGDRVLHWYTAVLFILLAITGVSLFFGRAALIPLFGSEGFAAYAEWAIAVHNYLGPFFVVGVLVELISWIKYNLPTKADWQWIRKLGGMLGHHETHPDAGRFNGGEKAWFWLLATVGVGVCITGLILDFPNFGQTRPTMQLANLIHGILALFWISIALGHIYLGTAGTEGTFEGMTTGRVSAEWAKQHHDLWYEEQVRDGGRPAEEPARDTSAPRTV